MKINCAALTEQSADPQRRGAVWINGVRVDDLGLEEALAYALQPSNAPCVVFTPNAVMLDACRSDAELRRLMARATLSLADGVGVLLAARRQGSVIRERLSGIDFGAALLKKAADMGLRVYFLGAAPGVGERAAAALCQGNPRLQICGCHHGYFADWEEEEAVVAEIADAQPDILLVCMGFPRQERWIAAHASKLPTLRVAAGLGGSLDVWAGNCRRAPQVVSRIGLEWAWRMIGEPRRFSHLPALFRTFMGF